MRVSKSDCDASNDSRMNQVLLMNEHGDIFKRQINIDECADEQYNEAENIPMSPIDSEYFYEQFIDYPLNDSTSEQTSNMHQPFGNVSPFSRNMSTIRNDTVLNYDQHKLQQISNKNQGGSTFTFFGMPLPSLSNLWGGGGASNAARKSNSRADVDPNGKSRLRNYRPRPGEIVENFQFSNNVHVPSQKPTPATILTDKEPTNIHPPPPPNAPIGPFASPNGYFGNEPNSDLRVEKGGFIPMLPGRKGFLPIQNPYANQSAHTNETDSSDVQETVSTELRPNINLEFDDNLDDIPDNKVLVPTVNAGQSRLRPSQFNVSSLSTGEITAPTKSTNGISLIRSTTPYTIATQKVSVPTTPRITTDTTFAEIERNGLENEQTTKNIQKIYGKTQKPTISLVYPTRSQNFIGTTPFYPTFMPNSSDVINLSKNRANGSIPNGSGITAGSALSALVAPGAQQGIFRPLPGRSVITKVFNNTGSSFAPTSVPLHFTSTKSSPFSSSSTAFTVATTSSPSTIVTTTMRTTTTSPTTTTTKTTAKPLVAHKLPTAEEYLRTTSQDNSVRESTTTKSHSTKAPNSNDLDDDETQYKGDMNWYYSNYNRSTWKEPQLDSSLYRFRAHSGSSDTGDFITSYFTITIFTLICAADILN